MYVRSLHPSNNFDSYISGEVTIEPSAAIAPGVLLQASPNSRIVIRAGVCIGMGSILHAYEGTLEVDAGATLGAGVLVVGKGKIGANACIGSTTTIMNCSIEPRQVVVAGSLIGDESRRVEAPAGAATSVAGEPPSANVQLQTTVAKTANGKASEPALETSAIAQTTSESTKSAPASSEATDSKVSGQVHLNRLLSTMFPHRQSLSHPLQDDQSPSDKT